MLALARVFLIKIDACHGHCSIPKILQMLSLEPSSARLEALSVSSAAERRWHKCHGLAAASLTTVTVTKIENLVNRVCYSTALPMESQQAQMVAEEHLASALIGISLIMAAVVMRRFLPPLEKKPFQIPSAMAAR